VTGLLSLLTDTIDESGLIAAAGLDVHEWEPEVEAAGLRSSGVVVAPHIASASHATRLQMCVMAAENPTAAIGGERPPNLFNGDVWDRTTG